MATNTDTNSSSTVPENRPNLVGLTREAKKTWTSGSAERFARISGDDNPLHLDPVYAAETRFGQPILHGALVASLVSAAIAKFPGVVIYLEQTSRFEQPAIGGNTYRATATLTEYLGNGRYTVETEVHDPLGERIMSGEATILIDLNE